MAKIFSFDSKPAQFFSRIWDLFLLNLMFIIGALPVVTIGVSAIAAYTVTLKIVEERENSIVLAFIKAYKQNFKQGIILGLVMLVALAAVLLDFLLFERLDGNPIGFLILGMVSAFLFIIHFFYAFALAARYKAKVFRHLVNSRNIFFRFYLRSLLCVALVAFEGWLFFMSNWLLLFIGAFIAPILILSTVSAFVVKFFKSIESEGGIAESTKEMNESAQDGKRESGIISEFPDE